jgi:hypothetical protein
VSAEQVSLIPRCTECEAHWLPADEERGPGVESLVAAQTRSAGRPSNPLGTVRQQSPVGLLRSPGTYPMPAIYVSCAVVVFGAYEATIPDEV